LYNIKKLNEGSGTMSQIKDISLYESGMKKINWVTLILLEKMLMVMLSSCHY